MEHTYTTLPLNTWEAYKKFVNNLSENWAFRGQLSSEWHLRNAIERTDFIHLYKRIEIDFLAEFQRGARNYLNKDETPEHIIEWLALMQHHGVPTRLLDFSKSPFIAAYFAFEQAHYQKSQTISIWAINYNYLKNRVVEELKEDYKDALSENKNLINEKLFEKIFYANNTNLVFPVEPFRMNRRYSLQQSIFVSTGIGEVPFMQQLTFLGADMSKAVIKMELPNNLQKQVLRDLQKMNLNRASLFPDLDGYALSLKLRYESLKSTKELIETSIKLVEDKDFNFFP